jgi:hypothetical protein
MRYVWILLLFTATLLQAQPKPFRLEGIVLSEMRNELSNINVTNMVSQVTVVTDAQGKFIIPVQQQEALKFSAVGYEDFYLRIEPIHQQQGRVMVKLKTAVYQLDEVNIIHLDAQKMGIIDYKPKKFTPAERRLETAGRFSPWQFLLIPLGGMPIDPLINAISGRTKRLEKELEVERREFALEAMEVQLDSVYFTDKLRLPPDRIKAFQYYAVENAEVRDLLKTNNVTRLQFKLAQVVVEFLKTKENE